MALDMKFKVPKFLKSIKYCLATVNSVFLITGLLFLLVGIIVLSSYSDYEEMITNRFFNIPALTVATGVIILLTAVLGFYGAVSQSFYSISAYVLLLLVVLVLEVAVVIAAFSLRNDSPTAIQSSMHESLKFYSTRLETASKWDALQRDFECCGVTSRANYNTNQIPISCCHIDYGTISPFRCGAANSYNIGCAAALGEWLAGKAYILAITALVVMCIQVLVASASGWLAWRSKFEEVELEQ